MVTAATITHLFDILSHPPIPSETGAGDWEGCWPPCHENKGEQLS